MRISDWSSDVCSSDLIDYAAAANPGRAQAAGNINVDRVTPDDGRPLADLSTRGKSATVEHCVEGRLDHVVLTDILPHRSDLQIERLTARRLLEAYPDV